MKPFLRYEQSGAIVTLTMDAAETRNALTGNSAPEEFVRFFSSCLDAGVYFAPSQFETGFISTAHRSRGPLSLRMSTDT